LAERPDVIIPSFAAQYEVPRLELA
jgi:hypothetical protein